MSDLTVRIIGIAVHAHHGALEEERRLGQRFVIDLKLVPLYDDACSTDSLVDAVDYAAATEVAQEVARGGPYHLLERLADEIATALLGAFPLREVTVAVSKPSAPIAAIFETVVVERTRRRP